MVGFGLHDFIVGLVVARLKTPQNAQKWHFSLKTAKSGVKWSKKCKNGVKSDLGRLPLSQNDTWRVEMCQLTDNVSKNLGKGLQFVGNC